MLYPIVKIDFSLRASPGWIETVYLKEILIQPS